jgi:hypothetical protein
MSDVRDAPATSDTVFRLIYRSHSRIPDATEHTELGNILRTARTNNATLGLTGALLLYDRWFAQVLEGPRDAVLHLFDRIKVDTRHDAVQVREQGEVPARLFARWAMANVGEHNEPDTPLTATRDGIAEGAPWTPTAEQDGVLAVLRDLTRGYGRGA